MGEEGLGRRVELERVVVRVLEVLAHGLREHLAELDAHLVEAVDVPDEALEGRAVLVEREQLAAGEGRQLAEEERKRRAVAREGLVRNQRLALLLLSQLLLRLPVRERVRLSNWVERRVGRDRRLNN